MDPCFKDDKAFLFQSFSFVDWKFPSTRAVNSVQVHFFPPIISFSLAHAKVLVSLLTILDSIVQILAAPARVAEFSSCHMQMCVHHSSNFLPLELSYVLGSAKIFDNLGAWGAAPSELDAAGLARARARLWLTVFSSLVTWFTSDSSWGSWCWLHPTDLCLLLNRAEVLWKCLPRWDLALGHLQWKRGWQQALEKERSYCINKFWKENENYLHSVFKDAWGCSFFLLMMGVRLLSSHWWILCLYCLWVLLLLGASSCSDSSLCLLNLPKICPIPSKGLNTTGLGWRSASNHLSRLSSWRSRWLCKSSYASGSGAGVSSLGFLSLGRAKIWVMGVNEGCRLPNQRVWVMVWEGLCGCK